VGPERPWNRPAVAPASPGAHRSRWDRPASDGVVACRDRAAGIGRSAEGALHSTADEPRRRPIPGGKHEFGAPQRTAVRRRSPAALCQGRREAVFAATQLAGPPASPAVAPDGRLVGPVRQPGRPLREVRRGGSCDACAVSICRRGRPDGGLRDGGADAGEAVRARVTPEESACHGVCPSAVHERSAAMLDEGVVGRRNRWRSAMHTWRGCGPAHSPWPATAP
jgi:hypothetical protein